MATVVRCGSDVEGTAEEIIYVYNFEVVSDDYTQSGSRKGTGVFYTIKSPHPLEFYSFGTYEIETPGGLK